MQGPSRGEYWFVSWVSLQTPFEAKWNFWLPEWPILNYRILRGKIQNASLKASTSPVEICGLSCTKWPASSLWNPSFPSKEGQQLSAFTDFISQIGLVYPGLLPCLIQWEKFKVSSVSSGRRSCVWSVSLGLFLGCPPPPPPGVQMVRSGPEEGEW